MSSPPVISRIHMSSPPVISRVHMSSPPVISRVHRMEYGEIVWDNWSIQESDLLESVQLEAARIIT
jgi:hypothetical protein